MRFLNFFFSVPKEMGMRCGSPLAFILWRKCFGNEVFWVLKKNEYILKKNDYIFEKNEYIFPAFYTRCFCGLFWRLVSLDKNIKA